MSTQTPDQDQDPSDQANADELEETTNESADENNAEQDPLEQAAAKLVECEEAAQRAKDDLLRVQAEMQNVRRRAEQDVEKAHKYGQEKFSIELLAVVDNLERSLEVASNNEDETVKAIYEGVNLTLKSFLDCFTKFNIEAVDPLGEPFDPQLHQAMSIQENAECEPNTVIAVMQKGYTLHGRVIRPAMVMVSK
ncbi:nucleotide exchange factor GrpE [Gammaproteobacteria bacterium]|jgi:molecular chaperone GrpE|nr:nucleotide exchange factor GrpE [Gammaproteobacteria bacterium]MBT6480929.1 nucleotide exchange factor GrpE [Gammaproteobacteria bacterium]MBT7226565.1 nucleotide exchange factor GrpE [Gammaproteobacteria bacterium]MDB3898423.1 nucleotide exchange factor GrpE [Gammaproteobacteria bacterium]MDC3197211.1 nucleotide exchange factor GrpE [Gammaproteobacteria bacterium]